MPFNIKGLVLSSCLILLLTPATATGQEAFSWSESHGKTAAQFSVDDWAPIVDATWGIGKSTAAKLETFDNWYRELDQRFGGHHNIDLDLAAMRDRYRPEIEAGVSRGRFAGIMTHFTYQLKELHTYLFDIPVRNTTMRKGIPMLILGHYGPNNRFGALLSALPDSTLLVYEALPNHPIQLQPGDVVLGYDGLLWKDIYPKLIEAELPLFLNPVHAATDEGNYHYAMQAAGLNWHLFDEIDIVKYATGDTLHFPTTRLASETRTIWGKDQIAPPGVPWPDRASGDRVGWGIIDGTNIGMVTVTSWTFDAQFNIRSRFRNAVDQLMNVRKADGIIFDFRYNTGGGALASDAFRSMFNTITPTVGFDRRVPNSADPLEMEPDPQRFEANLVIQGGSLTYYDNPIAILVGPGSISAGELEARRMSFHPRSRIFGLPAPGGNTGSDFVQIGDSDWLVSRAHSTQYLVEGHEYLTHIGLQPDEEVWFTQEDVANGVDTVIRAAMDWITSDATAVEDAELPSGRFELTSYPNPFDQAVTLSVHLEAPADVTVAVYDLLGREVTTLLESSPVSGKVDIRWDGSDMSGRQLRSGLYLWKVTAGGLTKAGSVLLVR